MESGGRQKVPGAWTEVAPMDKAGEARPAIGKLAVRLGLVPGNLGC